jgi:two-component system, response regulator
MSLSAQPIVILLVEDSTDDVFFFRRAIHKSGLAAVTHVAMDGVEAMDYLLNKGRFTDAAAYRPPDIMFLDLKLPHCNGFEVLEWMRRHAECPPTPVVVLTSSSQAEDQERAQALGAAFFLTKPAAPEQLRQALQKHSLARLAATGRESAI